MFKNALGIVALILSVINGFWLLRFYLRDKPDLNVNPIYPDIYQWWFELPSREYKGEKTRRFGFLLYLRIANKGLRKTTMDEWHLNLTLQNSKKIKRKPLNIPQPHSNIGTQEKYFNILGQISTFSNGGTEIDSGSSISGMTFFSHECYGKDGWNPRFKNENQIESLLQVKDVFGNIDSINIILSKKTIEEVEKFIPNFLEYVEALEKKV